MRVAIEAAWDDGPGEVGDAIRETRTVAPRFQLVPIRKRQLEELVAAPPEIGLSPLSGANDQIDPLRPQSGGLRRADDGDLKDPFDLASTR